MSELSKIGKILQARNLSQSDFIRMVHTKTQITFSPSRVCQYVNKKTAFLSSETLKIIAFTLDVTIDEIVDDWDAKKTTEP